MDRKGDKAVHFVSGEEALQEGQPVLQKVDWDRRWVVFVRDGISDAAITEYANIRAYIRKYCQ